MLDHLHNFNLISLSVLITCLLDNVWILSGEISCLSLLGVKGVDDFESSAKITTSVIRSFDPQAIFLI